MWPWWLLFTAIVLAVSRVLNAVVWYRFVAKMTEQYGVAVLDKMPQLRPPTQLPFLRQPADEPKAIEPDKAA
jgi:hypothetical protein